MIDISGGFYFVGSPDNPCLLYVPNDFDFGNIDTSGDYFEWREGYFKLGEFYNITFKDATVKSLCVAHWDANKDGELSNIEAAQVTENQLSGVFTGTSITSFDELEYFIALNTIPDEAFNGCKNLTSVVIPKNVKTIGTKAFYSCYKLTDVKMPEGLEIIKDNAFAACSGLTNIKIPSTVTTLQDKAFYYCRKMTSAELPSSLTNMGKNVFYSCVALRDVFANMMTPVTITSNVFSSATYSEGTLYVPEGKIPLYQAANYWKNFNNIVEREIVIAGSGSVHKGGIGNLDIRMDNISNKVALQTEIEMPQGFSIVGIDVNTQNGHAVSYKEDTDNVYRVAVLSLTNGQLLPIKDNVIMRIHMQAPAQAEPIATATARNNVIVDNQGNSSKFNDFVMEIDILDNRMGDVNGDDIVDVVDVVGITNHIIGEEMPFFVEEVADMNQDGSIDVADAVAVVMFVLDNETISQGTMLAPESNAVPITFNDDGMLNISTPDAEQYCAMQLDITLGEGMTLNDATSDTGHAVAFKRTRDNTYRLIIYSADNSTFSALGELLTLDIEGEGVILVTNGILATTEGEGYCISPATGGHATSINSIITDDDNNNTKVYTTSGQQIQIKNLPAGIYIVNGKKMVVK